MVNLSLVKDGNGLEMRDGIYKTLPLGRSWKSLLRSCEREKERGEIACARAKRALSLQTRAEVSAQFCHALNLHAMKGVPLFKELDLQGSEPSSRDLGGCNSPLENAVLKSYLRLQDEGMLGRDRVSAAFREGVEDLKRRNARQIEQHCLQEAGAAAKPILQAVNNAISKVETSWIIGELLEGKSDKAPGVRHEPIDLDEDLTKIR